MRDRRRQLRLGLVLWLLLPYLALAVGAGFLHTHATDQHQPAGLSGHSSDCAACVWSRAQTSGLTYRPVCVTSETVERLTVADPPYYACESHIRLASRAPPAV